MMRFLLCLFFAAITLTGTWFSFTPAQSQKGQAAPVGPFSPQEEARHFRLDSGLRIELVACEPQVESPVAMAFDEHGKLWVVEMRDYPTGEPSNPLGRIRILEDGDGDGFYEKSRIFADKLLFANGILPWKDGVLVTQSPFIYLLRDTDGDGKADKKEMLYEGFTAQNPQLRISHPNLGLDGWVYVANGLRGGFVQPAGKKDARPLSLAGLDFRFDLIHHQYEAISGMGQYGNTFDDWGRRFVCDNRHHLRHVVFENRYLKRNPNLAAPALVEDISELQDGPLNSGGKIYPLSKNWTTSNLHEGRFTAACGVFIYRGSLLPEKYRGAAFTCDPTGNLVHQEILTPKGATFEGRPARQGVEFFATPDDWCRPVFLTSGPEGALYMVDMYRAVIEHPDFMPPELKNRPDLNLGKDKGRIWRIVPEKHVTKAIRPDLGGKSTSELVALLEHEDAWWRATAQRLLLQRQDGAAFQPLAKLLRTSEHALARLHAAWLLEHYIALDREDVGHLLEDGHPRLREHAVRLAERRLATSKQVQDKLLPRAKDADARVRFQVALSLGEWNDDRIVPALADIALAGVEDKWTRLAVASAVPGRASMLLVHLLHWNPWISEVTEARLAMVQELTGLSVREGGKPAAAKILHAVMQQKSKEARRWQMAGLKGLIAANARLLQDLKAEARKGSSDLAPLARWLDEVNADMARAVADGKVALSERLDSIALLAGSSWGQASQVLTPLLLEDPQQEVRLASVRTLASFANAEVPGVLMKNWRSYTPAVRREVTEAMLRSVDRITYLLGEIEAKRVRPGDLDTLRTRQLVNHPNLGIRSRARKLLEENLPADRKLVLTQYQQALTLQGDAGRGKDVFKKHCATCHKIAGVGIDVGPDISDTRTKTPEGLLADILNPNQAIDNNYINYLVTTKSGKSLTGILVAETASSIILKRAEGQADVVLRQDVDEIQSSGVSLMPEAMEKTITIPEMADLLAFLKNWRYLEGAVPVGK